MADVKLPPFLSQKGNALVYNDDGEFLFYFPEVYFSGVKQNPTAQINGYYVVAMGVCDWALVDDKGKVSEAKPFRFPTIFSCKPYTIEKVKNLSLNGTKPMDYRICHFKKDDEVISDINVPQIIDNVETLFRLFVINGGRIPHTVPYDKMHEYFPINMRLNGNDYGIHMQLFGIMVAGLCRDPKDLSRPFRYTDMKDMRDYQQISVKMIPKYTSPYVALTSENWDESLMASILLSDQPEEAIRYSPIEKVVMN